ncbi:MAG TPA: FAD-dependent monooxygenase [Gaiellaceae bacterium]|nr:FAD-dependent monooxygenase [Gaiellaceae bacterium]
MGILIVGGGIGGLATSIALTDRGFDVRVVEIQPDLHSSVYGVGIIQPHNALLALEQIGCAQPCMEQGFPAPVWMRMHDVNGDLVRTIPGERAQGSSLPPLNGITRPKLHQILTSRALDAGVTIDYATTIDHLDDQGDHVLAVFSDASSATFDLVVGADGVRSTVRQYVHPEVTPTYNGQSAFRVNIPRDEAVDCIYLQMNDPISTGIVPLADDLAYLFLNVTWDRSRRPAQEELYLIMKEQLAPFGGLIGRVRDEWITAESSIVLRPEEWLIAPPPWHKGRIVLIGDSAHSVLPHLGQGAAQAIEDGLVLADELTTRDSVEDAFAAYCDRRYERCKFVVEACVQLGEWQQKADPNANPFALRQRVNELMLEPI